MSAYLSPPEKLLATSLILIAFKLSLFPFLRKRKLPGKMGNIIENRVEPLSGEPFTPLVSVIIPTRDRPAALERAIRSVLEQTFHDFEVIVVDNGIEPAQSALTAWSNDKRIRYFKLPQEGGRSKNRNHGLESAKGRLIAYLDDDDFFLPDHLETLVSAMTGGNLAVAYTDAVRVHERWSGSEMVEVGRDTPYSQDYDLRELLIENYIPILCLMHRRSCISEIGGFDESLDTREDWDLWLRLSQKHSFTHIPRVTCAFSWRTDGSSTTSSQRLDFHISRMKIYRRYRAVAETLTGVVEKQREVLEACKPRYFGMLAKLLEQEGALKNAVSARLALRALAHLPELDGVSEGEERDQIIALALVHLLKTAEAAAKLGIRGRGKALWGKLKRRIKGLICGKS
jgi:glycosyltransferase involved in cell wall biosynthesis